jgi:CheY-like chemotaxis protein
MIRVLAIDDEPAILRLISIYLGETGDIRCRCVQSAGEALERLQQASYDVIICDLNMGAMGGIDLLDSIRTQVPGTPVIIFTGREDGEVYDASASPGTYYLKKGISFDDQFEELITLIRTAAGGM